MHCLVTPRNTKYPKDAIDGLAAPGAIKRDRSDYLLWGLLQSGSILGYTRLHLFNTSIASAIFTATTTLDDMTSIEDLLLSLVGLSFGHSDDNLTTGNTSYNGGLAFRKYPGANEQ